MKKHFEMWRKGSLLLLAITFALVADKAYAGIDGLGSGASVPLIL